jgi:hypothetical protein
MELCIGKPPPVGAVTAFDFAHDNNQSVKEWVT